MKAESSVSARLRLPALDVRRLTEVGLTVRDTDLRFMNRKEFANSVPSSVTAAHP